MNEEELKKIWQTADRRAPSIDYAALQKTLKSWHENLRRRIRIDVAMQIAAVAIMPVIVWFYPKMFFLFWLTIVMAAWYIWEVLRFYRIEDQGMGDSSARQALGEKFLTLKKFIRRARMMFYCMPLVIIPAVYYALDYFEDVQTTIRDWKGIIIILAIGEIAAVVSTEIYFKIFYARPISEMKELLDQLDDSEQ